MHREKASSSKEMLQTDVHREYKERVEEVAGEGAVENSAWTSLIYLDATDLI